MRFPVCLALLLPLPALAQTSPDPWPFDLDPNITAEPAYVQDQIAELSGGLPGIPDGSLTEVELDGMRLYFHPLMAEAFFAARDSGPDFAPPLDRTPQACQLHASFTLPSLQLLDNSSACQDLKADLQTLAADTERPCRRVEYPETFVLDYEPGSASIATLSTFDGLIGVAGEALMHIDYQENLFSPDLMPRLRNIVAKLRYPGLSQDMEERQLVYQSLRQSLQAHPECFATSEIEDLVSDLQDLSDELAVVQDSLATLYQDGLIQAGQDLSALRAQGRLRDELLHPSLSDEERILLSFYVGGVYWRCRGEGLLAEGDGVRALYYVRYPFQLIAELNGGLAAAENVGFDLYVQENWGYADWMDMGSNPGRDKYADLVDMTIRGKRATALAAPRLENRGYDVRELVYGGLMMGPCYYYAWGPLRTYYLGEDLQDPYIWFIECPTATGEFCTGATLAVGLARTLLWGKPGEVCVADCSGRECGDDGCGGFCGGCDADESCVDGTCVGPGQDAGAPEDAGVPDAGEEDAGVEDAGGEDAGVEDAGEQDAGLQDAGGTDAGGGAESVEDAGGCGCAHDRGTPAALFLLALLALFFRTRKTPGG